MNESVQTGGLRTFNYNSALTLDEHRQNEIKEGYAIVDEKRKKDKRNKIIFFVILLILILILTIYILLRN